MIVSLFDESGNALRPWARAGFICAAYDIVNDFKIEEFAGGGKIYYFNTDLSNEHLVRNIFARSDVQLLMSWSPCTHLTVAGARHFAKKLAANPRIQDEAVRMARHVETWGNRLGIPWMAENPVGRLSTLWRKPDAYFHPWQYGGYLPENDVHPRWPQYYPPRDAYTKKTCIWHGQGFVMPVTKPVTPISSDNPGWRKLGGKSERTKQIRSEGPRGFLQAVFEANVGVTA